MCGFDEADKQRRRRDATRRDVTACKSAIIMIMFIM